MTYSQGKPWEVTIKGSRAGNQGSKLFESIHVTGAFLVPVWPIRFLFLHYHSIGYSFAKGSFFTVLEIACSIFSSTIGYIDNYTQPSVGKIKIKVVSFCKQKSAVFSISQIIELGLSSVLLMTQNTGNQNTLRKWRNPRNTSKAQPGMFFETLLEISRKFLRQLWCWGQAVWKERENMVSLRALFS